MDCSNGKLYPSKAAALADGAAEENVKMVDNERLTPFQRTTGKVSPNDPCPCGSTKSDGSRKKFKHCCFAPRRDDDTC